MSERLDFVNYHEYNFNFQPLHPTKNFQIHPYLDTKFSDSRVNTDFEKPNPQANDFKKNPYQICDFKTEKNRQDKPEVSIIILNYNQSELTLKSAASILEVENTMRFEIIVVDNGSHINQVEILEQSKFKKHYILVKSSVNGGFGYGNNLGAKFARS